VNGIALISPERDSREDRDNHSGQHQFDNGKAKLFQFRVLDVSSSQSQTVLHSIQGNSTNAWIAFGGAKATGKQGRKFGQEVIADSPKTSALGNPSVMEPRLFRPVTLRPRLSVGFALYEAGWPASECEYQPDFWVAIRKN